MGDAVAHLPRTDDSDRLDCHASYPQIVWHSLRVDAFGVQG